MHGDGSPVLRPWDAKDRPHKIKKTLITFALILFRLFCIIRK